MTRQFEGTENEFVYDSEAAPNMQPVSMSMFASKDDMIQHLLKEREQTAALITSQAAEIERLREALERARWYVEAYDTPEHNPEQQAALTAIDAALTASDAEREPVSATETTADTLQRFPKIMGALAKAEREPVGYCSENEIDALLKKVGGAPVFLMPEPSWTYTVPLYATPLPLTDLEAENARLRAELDEATVYARNLLTAFVGEHFPDNDRWKPLGDLAGMLTQIDNASTIAREYKARLAEALKALDAIIERSNNDPLGTSKVNDMRRIAEDAARRVREGGKADG